MTFTCRDGGEHEIVSPEDDDRYDIGKFARYNDTAGPRPNILWSHCANCDQLFRWSVSDQQWRLWPGGLSLLPHLSDEELDELHTAVILRMQQLGAVVPVAQATGTRSEINYKLRILQSLDTAIQEARYQLWPRDGDHKPRAWGEAWKALEQWVDAQLEGIGGSSQNDMTIAAAGAFRAVRSKILDLWKGTRP